MLIASERAQLSPCLLRPALGLAPCPQSASLGGLAPCPSQRGWGGWHRVPVQTGCGAGTASPTSQAGGAGTASPISHRPSQAVQISSICTHGATQESINVLILLSSPRIRHGKQREAPEISLLPGRPGRRALHVLASSRITATDFNQALPRLTSLERLKQERSRQRTCVPCRFPCKLLQLCN